MINRVQSSTQLASQGPFRKSSLILALLFASPVYGSSYLFSTSVGAKEGGLPVSASVSFDLQNSTTMVVTLKNLETNPTADDQAISFLTFSVNGNLGVTSIASSAKTVTIGGSGAGDYSVAATAGSTTWNDQATNGVTTTLSLCDINAGVCEGKGANWPEYALVGGPSTTNAYSNANGSLTNGAHNPLLFETETFTITGTNIPFTATATNTISKVVFGFGTQGAENANASFVSVNDAIILSPEPNAGMLAFAGAALILLSAKLKRGNLRGLVAKQ